MPLQSQGNTPMPASLSTTLIGGSRASWNVIIGEEEGFQRLVSFSKVKPTIGEFRRRDDLYKPKHYDLRRFLCPEPVEAACNVLFFNRTTYSGILRSGPMGGKKQVKNHLAMRWPESLPKDLAEARLLLKGRTSVECTDFERFILAHPDSFLYLDPPYVKAGAALYGPSIGSLHVRLLRLLHERADWLLSYDPAGAALYKGFNQESLEHYRSMSSGKKRPKDRSEYLIGPSNKHMGEWSVALRDHEKTGEYEMNMEQKSPVEEAAANGAAATARKSRSIARRKMSPHQQQYYAAIAMSSAELGAAIRTPTERIAQHVGNALAHDAEAKKERDEAQREFQENIAFYYEAKQRLLNPGYRTDVDGGKERTPAENEKNFGAPNWAAFAEKCVAYSLQHADRKLKAFAKANSLLTDDGENIDDPEPGEDEGAGRPQGRRTQDPTAQKRYEFIAAAAMEIASRNPEGEVEKQILAAAEHDPAPLMPVPSDVFTEVLAFLTKASSTDVHDRAEAMRLAAKMSLHKPAPDTAAVPPVVAEEEKRKRDKRLAKKNGQPLGSESCAPPMSGTSEHVQRSAPVAEAIGGTPPKKGTEEYKLRKARQRKEYSQIKKQAQIAVRAATPAAPEEAGPLGGASQDGAQPAAAPTARYGGGEKTRKHIASPEVTVCPRALSPEEEERKHGTLGVTTGHPSSRHGNFVCNEKGKWDYDPEEPQVA